MKQKLLKEIIDIVILFIQIYAPIIGLSWIFIHIHLRLFVERNFYSLRDLKNYITPSFLMICIVFILLHLIIILSILLALYRNYKQKEASSLFLSVSNNLSFIITLIYWKPLEMIYDFFALKIPGSGRFFMYLENKWTSNFYGKTYFYTLIFLFEILPKIMLALIFLIEIVILEQMHYFLYCISIILIPIGFNIFIKLLLTFSIINLQISKQYFSDIRGIGEPLNFDNEGTPIRYSQYEFIIKPEYETVVTEEDMELVLDLYRLQQYALQLKEDVTKVMPYISFITSIIYFIGGSYRLFFIIY